MAVVKPITTEFGHSIPPEGPHTVTFHIPRWETGMRFRDGDMTVFAQLRSLYPRFCPFGPAREVSPSSENHGEKDEKKKHHIYIYIYTYAYKLVIKCIAS